MQDTERVPGAGGDRGEEGVGGEGETVAGSEDVSDEQQLRERRDGVRDLRGAADGELLSKLDCVFFVELRAKRADHLLQTKRLPVDYQVRLKHPACLHRVLQALLSPGLQSGRVVANLPVGVLDQERLLPRQYCLQSRQQLYCRVVSPCSHDG